MSFLRHLTTTLAALLLSCATAHAVDVNKASEAELQTVKGIGPRMAAKLLDERRKGDFKDWNDMVERVPGVGPGNASKMSANGLTVNGTRHGATSSASTLARGSTGGHGAKGVIITPPQPAAAPAPATRPAVTPAR